MGESSSVKTYGTRKRKRDVVIHQDPKEDELSGKKVKVKFEKQVKTEKRSPESKRKRADDFEPDSKHGIELDTSKPSAVFQPKKGRDWTVSVALPGSFIANVKTFEQKSALASRIARACAVFCVDEIVVFEDEPQTLPDWVKPGDERSKAEILAEDVNPVDEPWSNPSQFLFHVLSFLETPPNLRKNLFPHHPNLKLAGAFPSLDMPHHMKADEWCQYREGVTLEPKEDQDENLKKKKKRKSKGGEEEESPGCLIDCGLSAPVQLPYEIPPNTRVTLKFANTDPPPQFPYLSVSDVTSLGAEATGPAAPREEAGYYWGYTIRRADSLSQVYTESAFEGGYDVSIGTSERGVPLSSLLPGRSSSSHRASKGIDSLPAKFKHLLIVFGGVKGLEPAVAGDPSFAAKGLTKETAGSVFDYWVNLLPGQGSRTIRTEEAVWIGLMGLKEYIDGME